MMEPKDDAVALVAIDQAARIAALEAALQTIAAGKEPMLHHPHRDQCTHGRSPDVECPHCIRAFARAALEAGQ